MRFGAAQQIADAVLYEGYALCPYGASSAKNQVRWQFGVLAPRTFVERTGSDSWFQQSECLIEPAVGQKIDVRVRGLQLRRRTIEARQEDGRFVAAPGVALDGQVVGSWDEGIEQVIDLTNLDVASLVSHELSHAERIAGDHRIEELEPDLRIVREQSHVDLLIGLSAERIGDSVKLRLRIENVTPETPVGDGREQALEQSLVGVHALIALRGGRFVSLLEPPDDKREAAAACTNQGAWPVLVGTPPDADLVLCAPVILYDYPKVAPESPGDLFDGTEIDEILSLRIMTLTDAEKAEARATDERARRIIDRVDALPADAFERMHGTFRASANDSPHEHAMRDLLNPPGDPPPEQATIAIDGATIGRGSRVILRPTRGADAIDMFVAGRQARVEGVYRDLEGRPFLAVVLVDDPGGDVDAEFGRFLYYGCEEVEPVRGVE